MIARISLRSEKWWECDGDNFGGFVVKVTLIEIKTCFPNANSTHQIIWGFEVSMAIGGL